MGDPVPAAASATRRRHRLFPALSLTRRQTIEQATANVTQGGSLAVTLSNNGLATAFRPYVGHQPLRSGFPTLFDRALDSSWDTGSHLPTWAGGNSLRALPRLTGPATTDRGCGGTSRRKQAL